MNDYWLDPPDPEGDEERRRKRLRVSLARRIHVMEEAGEDAPCVEELVDEEEELI